MAAAGSAMSDSSPAQLTASEAARRIREGLLTSEEFVLACIARIRTSRQLTPSFSNAGAPMTNAVAISTACRMIP